MPLTQHQLESIQADAMADDIAIDLERMSLWTEAQAVAFFESGGTEEPPPAAAAPPRSKEFDIVVYGPTGIVGAYLCTLLHEMRTPGGCSVLAGDEAPPSWAVAGRSKTKLEALSAEHGVKHFVTTEGDAASYDAVCSAASIVVAVAGPYRERGPREMAAACARAPGVAYLDITGDWCFVADLVEKHHDEARRNGSALISMCGPKECCVTECGARLAAERLRASGHETKYLE
eukprot:6223436-Prymnesium_polylepis.1